MRERPEHFRINPYCDTADGLVFAGLGGGGCVGSTHYHDSSLYGNHGTLTNMDPATDWVFDPTLGRFRLDFDGSNDVVDLPETTVGAWSAISVSAWVQIAINNTSFIIGRTNKTATDYDWGLYYSATSKKFAWYTDTSSGVVSNLDSTARSLNTWYHVCGTYNGAQSKLYINGVLVDTDAQTGTLDATLAIQIGAIYNSIEFGGRLADVLFHDRALSPAEIQQLADPSNTLLSGLILPPRRVVWPVAVAAPSIPEGSANLSAIADLTATGYTAHSGSSTLSAIASLTATGYHQSIASATISAIANLAAVGYTSHAGSANLSAIANLSATGYAAHSGSADLSAIADMVAVGESPSIIPEGSATLSAVADMTAVGYASHAGEAVLYAVADIAAVGYHESAGYAVLAAVADMVAVGSVPGEEVPSTGDILGTTRCLSRISGSLSVRSRLSGTVHAQARLSGSIAHD